MKLIKYMLIVIIIFMIGFFIGKKKHISRNHESSSASVLKDRTIWTCSMHPQIKLPKKGLCPICAMDLISLQSNTNDEGDRQFSMSEADMKLAEIQTETAIRKHIEKEIRLFGKIEYDETRLKTITAWINGRLDRLFVDYTGIPVKKGDHLAMIFSPELLTAQEELLQAFKRVKETNNEASEFLKESNQRTYESAKEKLTLWGIDDKQIKKIEKQNKRENHILLTAPIGGIVVQKEIHEGMYVKTGKKLFTIADLNHLWVKLDAYESDLPWLRYGQKVKFEVNAYPGEIFKGWISYIDPVLNSKTRTIKVRVNVENSNKKLKPEMFVTGIVRSKIAMSGKVMESDLANFWICPMHPEIRKEKAGICDICEMDLVQAKTMGFKIPDQNAEKPIVIPVSSVLKTGKRAVVYVKLKDKEKPTFEGREVILGPRSDKFYIVKSGIQEGEEVVSNGSFKIDSALQIQAKPSMMSMPGEVEINSKMQDFLNSLKPLYSSYLKAQSALAKDNLKDAVLAFNNIKSQIKKIDMTLLKGSSHATYMRISNDIIKTLSENINSMERAREIFHQLSNSIINLEEEFGHSGEKEHFKMFCPMAFDNKGASWLQKEEQIKNPYFGASMLVCGVVKEKFTPKGKGK